MGVRSTLGGHSPDSDVDDNSCKDGDNSLSFLFRDRSSGSRNIGWLDGAVSCRPRSIILAIDQAPYQPINFRVLRTVILHQM